MVDGLWRRECRQLTFNVDLKDAIRMNGKEQSEVDKVVAKIIFSAKEYLYLTVGV